MANAITQAITKATREVAERVVLPRLPDAARRTGAAMIVRSELQETLPPGVYLANIDGYVAARGEQMGVQGLTPEDIVYRPNGAER